MGRLPIALALVVVVLCACAEGAPRRRAPGPDVHLAPDTTEIRGLVPDDSTMDAMLRDHGLRTRRRSRRSSPRAARCSILAGCDSLQPFLLERTLDGALRLFEYEIDADSFLRVMRVRRRGGRPARRSVADTEDAASTTASGAIDETRPSLFQSIDAAGERADLAIAMAEIFAGEIDFNTDLQPGDRYSRQLRTVQSAKAGRPRTA